MGKTVATLVALMGILLIKGKRAFEVTYEHRKAEKDYRFNVLNKNNGHFTKFTLKVGASTKRKLTDKQVISAFHDFLSGATAKQISKLLGYTSDKGLGFAKSWAKWAITQDNIMPLSKKKQAALDKVLNPPEPKPESKVTKAKAKVQSRIEAIAEKMVAMQAELASLQASQA